MHQFAFSFLLEVFYKAFSETDTTVRKGVKIGEKSRKVYLSIKKVLFLDFFLVRFHKIM